VTLALVVSSFALAAGPTLRAGNDAAPLPALTGQAQPGDQERFGTYVVSVEWLQANYDKVIVLDARTKDEYQKGHLPNAVQAHWTDWANVSVKQGAPGWAVVLPPEELQKKFGELGIDGSKPVVAYNETLAGWGEEGRALWVFRVFGLANTYILNGGIKAWTAAGGATTKDVPDIIPVTGPQPAPNQDLIATTEYLAGKLNAVNLLDTREDEEYAGVKVYGEKEKGRIPGSKHIWFKDFYNADGTLQSPAQIRARVQKVGFDPKDEVVLYCTGGIRSGFATIALRIAGYDKARNYNASFSEWAGTDQQIDKQVQK
jgi:thiosulfate/3-mercaptopyruvate sulfurtransferase